MQHAANLAIRRLDDAMDFPAKNKQDERVLKTYKRRVRQHTIPMISEELIFEILVRLPVRDLIRFKSVCKAWHAIISDPFFVRMQLQQSTHKQEQRPSFLITPHIEDEMIDGFWPTFSNNISFYLWQEGQKDASLVRSMDFHGEFRVVYRMSHCDGLVMVPTDTKVYVLNPAIGDVLELPAGHKDVEEKFPCVALGLDPRTGKYKVVRSFYRSKDISKRAYDAGMEVFTIGGGDLDMCWRSTVSDPPYPVLQQGKPECLKGSIYWKLYEGLLESPPQGFLKFSLEDETFCLIRCPSLQSERDTAHLIVLGGELCLAQILATAQVVIWRSSSSTDGGHHWARIYAINLLEAWKFRPLLGTHTDGILLRRGNYLYRYDELNRFAREVLCVHQLTYNNAKVGSFSYGAEDVFCYNIIPYVESLVRVTQGKHQLLLSGPRVQDLSISM